MPYFIILCALNQPRETTSPRTRKLIYAYERKTIMPAIKVYGYSTCFRKKHSTRILWTWTTFFQRYLLPANRCCVKICLLGLINTHPFCVYTPCGLKGVVCVLSFCASSDLLFNVILSSDDWTLYKKPHCL